MGRRAFNFLQRSVISSKSKSNISRGIFSCTNKALGFKIRKVIKCFDNQYHNQPINSPNTKENLSFLDVAAILLFFYTC